jgi:hypothetical protein
MSLLIAVEGYSGYKANERPRQFMLDDDIYEIAAVLDQWYEPSAMYFKVQSTEGKVYLLRHDATADECTLQSGFDGDELLARPSIKLITVDADVIRRAEKQIEPCGHCHPNDAGIPFDWVLHDLIGNPQMTDFILSEPARCPNCKHTIHEKTFMECKAI